MKKYLKIYKVFWSNAVSFEIQYRGDAWLKIFFHLIQLGILFLFVEVVFSITPELGGWTKPAVYLLTVFWVCVDETAILLFWQNIATIPEKITDGTLDGYLVKPTSVLFLVSTKHILIKSFYRLLLQLVVLGFLFVRFDIAASLPHILFGILAYVCALVIYYAVILFLNTWSFWFYRIDNVNDLWLSFAELGKYPLHLLPKTFQILFLTFIPVAFSGFVPAAVFTGNWPWYSAFYPICFAVVVFVGALKFWHYAVQHYTSASG